MSRWQEAATAPKTGEHILVTVLDGHGFGFCGGKRQDWCAVVHWWDNRGEEGFYLSSGGSDPIDDHPVNFTHWMPLPTAERRDAPPTREPDIADWLAALWRNDASDSVRFAIRASRQTGTGAWMQRVVIEDDMGETVAESPPRIQPPNRLTHEDFREMANEAIRAAAPRPEPDHE